MICFPKAVLVLDILTSFTFNDGALPSNTVTSNVKFFIESFFFQINLFPNPFLYLCRLNGRLMLKSNKSDQKTKAPFLKKEMEKMTS